MYRELNYKIKNIKKYFAIRKYRKVYNKDMKDLLSHLPKKLEYSQVFLFDGEDGVGKSTFIYQFAKFLNKKGYRTLYLNYNTIDASSLENIETDVEWYREVHKLMEGIIHQLIEIPDFKPTVILLERWMLSYFVYNVEEDVVTPDFENRFNNIMPNFFAHTSYVLCQAKLTFLQKDPKDPSKPDTQIRDKYWDYFYNIQRFNRNTSYEYDITNYKIIELKHIKGCNA